MSDDIVDLLREITCGDEDCLGPDCNYIREAAEEIEMLRKMGDQLAEGIRRGSWDDALDDWTNLRHG